MTPKPPWNIIFVAKHYNCTSSNAASRYFTRHVVAEQAELCSCRHMTKVSDHVGFVLQQSIDKIGDLSVDNRGFCLQVCTKPNKRFVPNLSMNNPRTLFMGTNYKILSPKGIVHTCRQYPRLSVDCCRTNSTWSGTFVTCLHLHSSVQLLPLQHDTWNSSLRHCCLCMQL